MANCNNITSILKGCAGSNQGGIFSVYINDTDNVVYTANTAHTITSITNSGTSKFQTFEFNRNVGNVVIDNKTDLLSGSQFYEAKVTLMFHRREAAKSRALQILSEGQRFLEIIFLDATGQYWYIDHAQLDGGAEETGTARGDGSKYTVTFTAQMTNRPYLVQSSIVAGIIGVA
jgi:hypothetical protein